RPDIGRDVGSGPGRGAEPDQLVEEGLVGGDEQRVSHDIEASRDRRRFHGTDLFAVDQGSPGDDCGRQSAPYSEAMASSRQAAFFDLDKTIIAKSSTLAFSKPFQAGGLISRKALLRSVYSQFVYVVGGADHDQMEKMRRFMSELVAGWDVETVREIV